MQGDDLLSVRHWLYTVTGIVTEGLDTPKDFERPVWFVEPPSHPLEPQRPGAYRARVTLYAELLADTFENLRLAREKIDADLAERRWVLPYYDANQQQVGFLRECRLNFKKSDGLNLPIELKYLISIPYTAPAEDELTEIHTTYRLKG